MKGMTSIGKVFILETFEVFLVDRLQEQHKAYMHGDKVYFDRTLPREQLVESMLGFASRIFRIRITQRVPGFKDWPEGLWIGDRQIRVQIVKHGTEPHEYFIDLDENIVLIQDSAKLPVLLIRVAAAAVAVFATWNREVVRRAFRREKASVTPDVPHTFDAAPAKQKRKPRVKPGELLPSSERDSMLAQGDEILRQMFETAPKPADKPKPDSETREAA